MVMTVKTISIKKVSQYKIFMIAFLSATFTVNIFNYCYEASRFFIE
jgi:hypothetical protein